MEMEVGGLAGAAYREKSGERLARAAPAQWSAHPKRRKGSHFPGFP